MRTVLICLALLPVAYLGAGAQSLYMPRNVEAAFARGTRSPDGLPGAHYWQNHGRYDISLTVMPPDRRIEGVEKITYFNDSPDTLKELVIRLILNFHRPEAVHLGWMDSLRFTSGIHIDRFAVNGKTLRWRDPRGHETVQGVPLASPLAPHDSVQLSIAWHDEIARVSGREGMIDSTTYYIAYFYPRISVYDDYNGWDRLLFTGYQEFYNDFNDYSLQVTVPANYIVWATGTLENPREVLQPEYAARLRRSLRSDSVIRIATRQELAAKKVTLQHGNTWKWKARDVTDVAVAVSDHYDWDGSSVVVDTVTGRRAAVQAAYNDTARDFHRAVANGTYALGWFSRHWPGVPYPYPKMTVFQGYADMEYPMMVNDASEQDPAFSRLVEDHEIAHTYFPFYMGTNESRYAFMDEGWATTFELLIGRTEEPVASADSFYRRFRVNRWIHDPSQEEQVPIITPANIERGLAYGSNAYVKPSLGYLALKGMLGDSLFRKCLHAYMERWHGKHPIPWDFFNTFSDVSGQNLDWFWNSWFFSHGYDDLGIGGVTKSRSGYSVTVKNAGGFPVPFHLIATYADGTRDTTALTAEVWKKDLQQAVVTIGTKKKISSLRIDNGIWMDANEADNTWKPLR